MPEDLNRADATRTKLLEAAAPVFASKGFYETTVREICGKAGVNVAAVNYHFGDKLGLYIEVLKRSFSDAQTEAMQEAMSFPEDLREGLRRLIRTLFEKVHSAGRPSWYIRIMIHEMAQPTPALDRVVNEIIGPNYFLLRKLVAGIIGYDPDHDQTRMCAHSIIGQILHYALGRPVISRLWPSLDMNLETQHELAAHIAEFSIAGLESVAKSKRST